MIKYVRNVLNYARKGSGRSITNTMTESNSRIVWIDMEMTGLCIEKDQIMEVACLVTDSDLNIIKEGPNLILHVPDDILNSMHEWCMKQHNKTGLTELSQKSKITVEEAEKQLLKFISSHTLEKCSPLAGNSVYMDRLFLRNEARKFVKFVSDTDNIDIDSVINQNLGKGQKKRKIPAYLNNTWDDHQDIDDTREVITPPPGPNIVNNASKTFKAPKANTQNNNTVDGNSKLNGRNKIEKISDTEEDTPPLPRDAIRTISIELETTVTTVAEKQNATVTAQNEMIPPATLNNIIQESPFFKQMTNHFAFIKEIVERLAEAEERRATAALKSDKENKIQNKTALFLLGGTNYKEQIRKGLKKLFLDKLATKCS
ncbi:hypothetical protein RN001_005080 [Aquatica leii]|uniref:Exonuclease domain-containing protein n=1 Tax=Aquatica leii TaxID=1421715 RepID=A0AAN7SAE2_9COLE|nr:hypothetical protein RN001_005080 [Aquatica leii]